MFKKIIGILFVIFSVTACADADTDQYIEEIENASQAFSEVDSGRFNRTNTVERDGEAVETEAAGTFVRTDEGMDWQTVMAMEGPDSNEEAKTERVSIDSDMYERFGRVDEEGRYIDQGGEVINDVEWTEVEADLSFPLNPLLAIDFDASMIEEITKDEREYKAIYTVNYTEEFLEQQKEENLSDLQNELEGLQEANVNEHIIQAAEQNMAYHDGLSYESMGLEVLVDNNGVLVEYLIETEVNESITIQPENEPGRMVTTNRIELLEYNDPAITITLEELE